MEKPVTCCRPSPETPSDDQYWLRSTPGPNALDFLEPEPRSGGEECPLHPLDAAWRFGSTGAWVHWHWSRCRGIRGALLNADSSPYNAATFHATQCPVVGAVSLRAAGAGSLQVEDRSLIEPGLLLAEMT